MYSVRTRNVDMWGATEIDAERSTLSLRAQRIPKIEEECAICLEMEYTKQHKRGQKENR